MESENVRSERSDDGVLTLTIDRVDKKNALRPDMYAALSHQIRAASDDLGVGAVVLTGAGGVFTAGNDLAAFMAVMGEGGEKALHMAIDILYAASETEAPLIAAVEGPAVGVGSTILAHCDGVFASPGASFQTPFVNLALCPEGASSLLFPSMLGRAATRRMLLEGAPLSAAEAAAAGLVDEVVDDPLAEATALARRLAEKPREAMRTSKRLIREARGDQVRAAIEREAQAFLVRLRSKEAQDRFAAFFSKKAAG